MSDLLLRAPIQYEPKTNNRWLLRFPTDIGIQSWAVVSCDSPKMTLETKEMAFINTSTYVNTMYKWGSMSITLRDMIAPSQSQALMEWLRLCAESVTGRMGYAIGYAKTLELESLDPTGVAVEKWVLVNAIPTTETSFGTLDYNNSDVRTISFSIQPQYCIHLYG